MRVAGAALTISSAAISEGATAAFGRSSFGAIRGAACDPLTCRFAVLQVHPGRLVNDREQRGREEVAIEQPSIMA
jgi:hypothetical protein